MGVEKYTEPHYANGIVSNAAAEVQRELGWEKMTRIFYDVITAPEFDTGADFEKVAQLAVQYASNEYGTAAVQTVRDAFADNAVDTDRTKPMLLSD